MGRFSFFGLFKSSKGNNKKVRNGEDYGRDDMKAYKVWPSDEDRGCRWVAEPGIDGKADAFINGKTKFWSNDDFSN